MELLIEENSLSVQSVNIFCFKKLNFLVFFFLKITASYLNTVSLCRPQFVFNWYNPKNVPVHFWHGHMGLGSINQDINHWFCNVILQWLCFLGWVSAKTSPEYSFIGDFLLICFLKKHKKPIRAACVLADYIHSIIYIKLLVMQIFHK